MAVSIKLVLESKLTASERTAETGCGEGNIYILGPLRLQQQADRQVSMDTALLLQCVGRLRLRRNDRVGVPRSA